MNKHLEGLVMLSNIDKSVDSFTPQIELAQKKVAKAQAKLDAVVEKMETLKSIILENESKTKNYEDQIDTLNEQLKSIQKKNKEISTEKEMKALSMEEELAKEKLSFANEEIERIGNINEAKTEELEELEPQLEELSASIKEVEANSTKIIADIEKQKAGLYEERMKCIEGIENKIYTFYEKVRNWAGNTAVVPVKNQACYGCYMKINDKSYSEVISGEEIANCPHCGRIMYLKKQEEEIA